MKKHKGKILVLFLAVLLVSVLSCENPFLKKMLVEEEKGKTVPQVPKHTITFGVGSGLGTLKAEVDGNEINSGDSVEQGKSVVFTAEPAEGYVLEQWTNAGTVIAESGTDKTYTHSVTANADIKVKFQAPFVEGGASLILSPDKLDIKVKVTTADNSSVRIEGCTETSLISGTETVLHAKGSVVILKGNITELKVGAYYSSNSNKLTALNVQGLTALQRLGCWDNQLNADAFKKLFDDLPVRQDSDDAKCLLYTEQTGITEGNHTDFTAPPDLKDAFDKAKIVKKWKMYKRDGSGSNVEI
ncbi:hypothetical protein OE909_04855 [Treponema denticola]|uniref:InlB B-repeat-containing protein n=1 Tax=Treponema denticola TaxID=158 RepID=UPI0021F8A056|nr:hypothetical protein [Treponema denticola]UYT08775.1 hypothetical protein OE909_04855 [Treponema denticola]